MSDSRRRHLRAQILATVTLCQEGRFLGIYLVENLSAGGALITGDPILAVGTRVQALVHIAGRRPISTPGHVKRHQRFDDSTTAIALEFHASAEVQDELQDAVLRILEKSLPASTLPATAARRSAR
jgi:PilZ domain